MNSDGPWARTRDRDIGWGAWGLEFRAYGFGVSGFRVWGLGVYGLWVQGLGIRGFRFYGLPLPAYGVGLRV